MKHHSITIFLISFLLFTGLGLGSQAQQAPASGKAGQQPAPVAPAKPQIGQAGSPAEMEAFNKLRAEPDTTAKKRMIEEFLKTYPESGLTAYVHQEASYLGQQMNNFEVMIDHGEKSLAIIPENFTLMTILANAYVERNFVDKAEEKAEKAIDLVQSFAKPPAATEEQWTQGKSMLLSTNFSTLGYVHLRRAQGIPDPKEKKAETERSIAPFKKALEHNKVDDISLWRLGLAHVFLNDYANAESNLAKAVAVNGVAASNARSTLEDIYKKQHKNSLDGLDKVVAKAKSELGLP
jgi:tetratricopeptide (TPR) repeat protein